MENEAYTMSEYIAKMGLKVDPQDTFATKLIAKHLRSLGFEQRKVRMEDGSVVHKWVRDGRKEMLSGLVEKLKEIEQKDKRK